MTELGELIAAVNHAEAKFDSLGLSDPVLLDAAAHDVMAAQLRLRAYLRDQRGETLSQDPRLKELVETLAQVVHATWRDTMRVQDRDIAPERLDWSTLPERDKEIDRAIARAMLWHLCGVDYRPEATQTSEQEGS
jgi:hypothetical protein